MTDRELMQQALEALCCARDMVAHPDNLEFIDRHTTALRERLAQPEQDWDWRHPKAQALIGAKARLEIQLRLVEQLVEDPNLETTASDMEYWEPLHDKLQERLAQPEQEPFCYHDGRNIVGKEFADHSDVFRLYTAPQPRQWQGLTDEEMKALFLNEDDVRFARYIESRLKDKNA